MTQPLALVLYERLLPGSQLVNRLQDLNYRVQTISDPKSLVASARESKPIVVLVDLESGRTDVAQSVSALKQDPSTNHLPVIGLVSDPAALKAAQFPGLTLMVGETAILTHLPQFLEQALQID